MQDASGQQAQRAIQLVLDYLGRQLGSKLTWQHRQLRNPLADVALAPVLRLSPATSLAVQVGGCARLSCPLAFPAYDPAHAALNAVLIQRRRPLLLTAVGAAGAGRRTPGAPPKAVFFCSFSALFLFIQPCAPSSSAYFLAATALP
jgi:hypothetical protein